jgi:hypothetical protein
MYLYSSLFNDAISEPRVSNDWMKVNNELERTWKKVVRYCVSERMYLFRCYCGCMLHVFIIFYLSVI